MQFSILNLALVPSLIFAMASGSVIGRSPTNVNVATTRSLERRFDNARITFFDPGLGACGVSNTNADFVVALNAPQWEAGSHCLQHVSINANGKTIIAQVVDLCPSCPLFGLDLSRGLFDQFASEDVGVISGTWNFV